MKPRFQYDFLQASWTERAGKLDHIISFLRRKPMKRQHQLGKIIFFCIKVAGRYVQYLRQILSNSVIGLMNTEFIAINSGTGYELI